MHVSHAETHPPQANGGASDVTLVAREVTTAGALIARLPRETVRLYIGDPSDIDCAPPHVPTAGLATPSFVPTKAAQQGTALPQLAVPT